MRIGQGFDVHKFGGEEPLIIGGICIPFETGLVAHSDGDVLLHAITDALLGAAALGDIGTQFPDTDSVYKNADSRILLRKAYEKVRQKGYVLTNLDATIIAERPKMKPFITAMQHNISQDLAVIVTAVSVKATTTEGLGFCGRGEGIACSAVVLLAVAP